MFCFKDTSPFWSYFPRLFIELHVDLNLLLVLQALNSKKTADSHNLSHTKMSWYSRS